MVPCNNPEKFVSEHGHWWYLREFDFLPEPLELYSGYLSLQGIKAIYSGEWALFTELKDAREASNKVRKIFGLKEIFVGKDLEPIWTNEGKVIEITETIKDGD